MAESRKNASTFFSSLTFILTLSFGAKALRCLSNENKPVDWFIGYKLPDSARNVSAYSMMYMDSDNPSWRLVPGTLDTPRQAIYYTLSEIYTRMNISGTTYAMYNDALPTNSEDIVPNQRRGHTKGVLGFDKETGFWLVQSTPKFPPARNHGYSFPNKTYAQSFLCISMETSKNLNAIGKQLQYNWPLIYDQNLPKEFADKYGDFKAALEGNHVIYPPWYSETKLVSLAGVTFTSFAKYWKWEKDLYADWLASSFNDSLLVQTWHRGNRDMGSSCNGTNKVMNVVTLGFNAIGYNFKSTQDHSKWAITNSSNLAGVCIGDINRQKSQMKRSGGTVCFQHKNVWTAFNDLVKTIEPCNN
ncbi:plancitoxin-1-like isoform X1 [Mya arenaria]|uniref:plancitoxin-1-like isoform X1 n=1 Tax=Mya arenaria TaxID=6604 RepID=UPI0022E3D298|nr:plancitoxin-1-like isoform X1 [Mya arenaria]